MNCNANLCTQGRQPCPTPWACGNNLHRVLPPITKEGGATIEFEEARPMPITMEDDSLPFLAKALFVVVALGAVGVVLLPFILGAVA